MTYDCRNALGFYERSAVAWCIVQRAVDALGQQNVSLDTSRLSGNQNEIDIINKLEICASALGQRDDVMTLMNFNFTP